MSLTVDDLERTLKAVDPAVFLVPPRILRRVIKHDCGLRGMGLQVPHRKGYVLHRDRLLDQVARSELGLPDRGKLPPDVILLARPDPDRLAALTDAQALGKYWRLLFHARVHLLLERKSDKGRLSEAALHERIRALGVMEFQEIRAVLRHENFLLPPGDARAVYIEFAALYLELRHFNPALLPRYFPTLGDFARIDALLAEDIDGAQLFAETRPAGAVDPAAVARGEAPRFALPAAPPVNPALVWVSAEQRESLLRQAKDAAEAGNTVRAALLHAYLAGAEAATGSDEQGTAAGEALARLVQRLEAALGLGAAEAAAWRHCLTALLLPGGPYRVWTAEARLLYDLQKVCFDHERPVFAVDLVEWVLSLGRKPIRRQLPGQREVQMVRHLRRAAERVHAVRLDAPGREHLDHLIHAALHRAEAQLRDRFRGPLHQAMAAVNFTPGNLPEAVALNKVVEELLDGVVERGFLNMSDLRDAVSRNGIKLPDLAGPGEFLAGDLLLKANRELAVNLDGVYRRGEIYLRWMQRFSSLGFGTPPGRFLTRYLVLPFGGAFVALEGLHHLAEFVAGVAFGGELDPFTPLQNTVGVLLLGFFLLGLLYSRHFRDGFVQVLRGLGRGLKALAVDLPARVVNLPPVRYVLQSRPVQLFARYLVRPLVPVAVSLPFLLRDGFTVPADPVLFGGVFLAGLILFNTRFGRDVEELAADFLVRWWAYLRTDLIPGLFRFVVALFKQILEAVERLLYSVDEWLRFRSHEGRLALVVKPILGLIWFTVTYVVRFGVNLLLEPQINPIKHFPVVTVSHKLVLAFGVPPLAHALSVAFNLPAATALTAATTIGFMIPGIFGFLVWEFKENWKLYQANRPPVLKPVLVGSHGETVLRLLRPGFHSGTLPKLYAKLRRAERRRNERAVHKHQVALEHVAEQVRHFLERELVDLLARGDAWGGLPLAVGPVHLSSNRVRVELACPRLGPDPFVLAFEEHAGRLTAVLAHFGWTDRLTAAQALAFQTALTGLYNLAGAERIRDAEEERDTLPWTWANWVAVWEGLKTRPDRKAVPGEECTT